MKHRTTIHLIFSRQPMAVLNLSRDPSFTVYEKRNGRCKDKAAHGPSFKASGCKGSGHYCEDRQRAVCKSGICSSVPSIISDEYAAIQRRSAKLVFSYGTALFFHGMTDRVPHIIDVTVPQGYNIGRIKKTYGNLRFHYVKPDILYLGFATVITPQGSKVAAYNRERCICDLLKDERKMDKQIYTQAVKEYFTGEYKPKDILKMAKAIGVEAEVRRYMEVLI